MTERKKDLLALTGMLALLIAFFCKILFTDQIIRAPDITAEFYWTIKQYGQMGFWDLFRVSLQAGWDTLANGGGSEGGGTVSMQFLLYRNLIFWLFPEPVNIAWFIVLHLFFGGAGAFFFCRAIGCSRPAAFFAGILFAVAPENASLINAGHVQKIATISFAPWVFYFLEVGFQRRRLIYFLTTSVLLAFQFFNMHWQVAYYTCLALGCYALCRYVAHLISQRGQGGNFRLLLLNLATLLFFLSTVAISLVPLANWSQETTRGGESGANQGKGGLDLEEAMSWSLPPEELATFAIPGLFGYSRQEGGGNSNNIDAYYLGRMNFTQTSDYLGLLPWLLAPLPFFIRRNRYSWLAGGMVAAGITFSLGKYSAIYWFLFEHFPGINHFRVPKMMMFIPLLGLGILAAQGVDLLLGTELRDSRGLRWYRYGVPLIILGLLASQYLADGLWRGALEEMIVQPTRYQQGAELVTQRWDNLQMETGWAAAVAVLSVLGVWGIAGRWFPLRWGPFILFALFLADVGRVNAKYTLLQPVPKTLRAPLTPAMEYVKRDAGQYRVLPMNSADPMTFVSNGIPVLFTSNPVQMWRWQLFLDNFGFGSGMPDFLNVKYLVYDANQYEREKGQMGDHFVPVYRTPDGKEIVLQNRRVFPKGWLVPAVAVIDDPRKIPGILANPAFDPLRSALVESPPPLTMAPVGATTAEPGTATVISYDNGLVTLQARAATNALLVLGDKYFTGWSASVDGRKAPIVPVNLVLRGVYLTPGDHVVTFHFDPLPFKIGKWLTLISFAFFTLLLAREWRGVAGVTANGVLPEG
jgi:hypothetical protein